MRIPARIVAGDTVTWQDKAFYRRAAPNDLYINSGAYNLSYTFLGPIQSAALSIVGVSDGADWDMTLAAAQSGPFNPTSVASTWWWQAFATSLSVSAAVPAAAGSGYNVNDQVTLANGVVLQVLTLTGEAGSGIASVGVISGAYTGALTNPFAQAATTGAGTSATFNLAAAAMLAGQGEMVVEPNFATLAGSAGAVYSGLSLSEQQLQMVRAEITARLGNHARTEYTIGNRHLKFEPMEALLSLQSRLELQIAREKTAEAKANGLGNPSTMMIRFGDRGRRGWGG